MSDWTIALLPQVEITSNNKYIDVYYSSAEHTATVPTGTYDNIWMVVAALETELKKIDATFTATLSTLGKITIARTGTFSITWLTGTNHASSIGALLGYVVTSDDTSAATYTSDYQHKYGWYSEYPPESDTYETPMVIGGALTVAESGLTRRSCSPTVLYEREIVINNIRKEKFTLMHASGTWTNHDLATTWGLMAAGYLVSVFYIHNSLFVNALGSIYASASAGEQYSLQSPNSALIDSRRISPQAAYYGPVKLRLRGVTTTTMSNS